ncbi:MAG: calcium-binding protein, partial [Shimia sp.]|uniref:beta strand repeat-containing protein n=1 Tax=Shimia sp. TaxID=1954381 RepID=UPI001B20D80A
DLSGVAADVITLGTGSANGDTAVLTVASGASLVVAVDQTTLGVDGSDVGAATNTATITLNDGVDDANAVDLTATTITDMASVTIDASVDTIASSIGTITATADNTDVTIEAGANGVTLATAVDLGTGDLVINSTAAVTGTGAAITANSLTATGSGAVTLDSIDASTLATVTTDSGNDQLTVSATGASLTLDAGDGTNTVTLGANTTNSMTYTLSAGSGFDTLELADTNATTALPGAATAGTYTGGTIVASGFERIRLVAEVGDANTAVTVANSLLDGQSYIMTTTDAAVNTVEVVLGTGEVSSDLSGLTFDNTFQAANDIFEIDQTGSTANLTLTGSDMINTFTTGTGNDVLTGGDAADVLNAGTSGTDIVNGGAGNDQITTAAGADTVDGGDGGDTIITGAGDDSITGGEGTDGIIAGDGADTIILTETTSVDDNVQFTSVTDGAAAVALGNSFSGFDVITGFISGSDDLVFDADTSNVDDNVDTSVTQATPLAPTNGTPVTYVAGTAATVSLNDLTASNYTSIDAVLNFFNDGGAGITANLDAGATGDFDIVAVTIGSGTSAFTAVYGVEDDDATIDATEVTLIGIVDATLVAGDIIA